MSEERIKFCISCEREIQWRATSCRSCGKEQPPPPSARAATVPQAGRAGAASPATRRQAAWAIALLAVIAALQVAALFPEAGVVRPRPKYEYKIESYSDTTIAFSLDEEGRNGWRVVGSRRATTSYGSALYELILMRER